MMTLQLFETISGIVIISLSVITSCGGGNKSHRCPSNFLYVPEFSSPELSTQAFCVAQHEMSKGPNGLAVSESTGTPWKIFGPEAFSACHSLRQEGFNGKFSLLSYAERTAVEEDIKKVSSNKDNLQALTRKTTYTLSSGGVIWHFATNLDEWIDWDVTDAIFTQQMPKPQEDSASLNSNLSALFPSPHEQKSQQTTGRMGFRCVYRP